MALVFRTSLVSEVKCSRGDISLMALLCRLSCVSEVKPLKSPDFSDVMPLEIRLSVVISAMCMSVTSSGEVMSGSAATIASRTSGVRSLSGGLISFTFVTLIVTVILSLPPLLSETKTVTE